MKSKAINKLIRNLCNKNDDNIIYESCIGEKLIPYIGWFWRDVDFDADKCWLGVLPKYESQLESNDSSKVGFMENNKWGYSKFIIEGEGWIKLKNLITKALKTKVKDDFKCVDDYMQSLLPDKYK